MAPAIFMQDALSTAYGQAGASGHGRAFAVANARPVPGRFIHGGEKEVSASVYGGLAGLSSRAIPIQRGSKMRTEASALAETAIAPAAEAVVDLGYDRDIDSKYAWGEELGKGKHQCVRWHV